jgi:hypothetical protein
MINKAITDDARIMLQNE